MQKIIKKSITSSHVSMVREVAGDALCSGGGDRCAGYAIEKLEAEPPGWREYGKVL